MFRLFVRIFGNYEECGIFENRLDAENEAKKFRDEGWLKVKIETPTGEFIAE